MKQVMVKSFFFFKAIDGELMVGGELEVTITGM